MFQVYGNYTEKLFMAENGNTIVTNIVKNTGNYLNLHSIYCKI